MTQEDSVYTADELYFMGLDPNIIDKVCSALNLDHSLEYHHVVALTKVLAEFAGEAVDDSWSDYHASRA